MRFGAIMLALLALAQAPLASGTDTSRWGTRVLDLCPMDFSNDSPQQICEAFKGKLVEAKLQYPDTVALVASPAENRRLVAADDMDRNHRQLRSFWKKLKHFIKSPAGIATVCLAAVAVVAPFAAPVIAEAILPAATGFETIGMQGPTIAGYYADGGFVGDLGIGVYRRLTGASAAPTLVDVINQVDCTNTTVAKIATTRITELCEASKLQIVPQAPVRINPDFPFDSIGDNFRATLEDCQLAAFYADARAFFYDHSGMCTLVQADPVEMSAAPELSRDIMYSPEAYLFTVHDPRNKRCLKECLTTARNMRKQWNGCGAEVTPKVCRQVRNAAYATTTAQCELACSA